MIRCPSGAAIVLALAMCGGAAHGRDYRATVAALVQVESGGDCSKKGDHGRAVGPLQMWPCAVAQANRVAGRRVWTLADRADPWEAQRMACTLLRWQDIRTGGRLSDVELACRWRNPHGGCPGWYVSKIANELKKGRQ